MERIVLTREAYCPELEAAFNKLQQGQKKVANVKTNRPAPADMFFAEMVVGTEKRMVRIMQIGANSFGLEVKVSIMGVKEWTSIDQFTPMWQKHIAAAIDWNSLQ